MQQKGTGQSQLCTRSCWCPVLISGDGGPICICICGISGTQGSLAKGGPMVIGIQALWNTVGTSRFLNKEEAVSAPASAGRGNARRRRALRCRRDTAPSPILRHLSFVFKTL